VSYSRKIPFALGQIAAATALSFSAGMAHSQIVADGKLETTDYQLGFSVGFIDDAGNAIGDGRLYFGSNATGQFLYFQMPLTYVDNTYGTNASSGWTKGHTFSDFLGSDSFGSVKKGAGVGFGWGANSVQIDYIAGVGCSSTGTGCTDYRSGGVGLGADAGLYKVDGQVYSGSAASILEMATSLEYNLNQYPSFIGSLNSPASVAAAPNWIYEVGYEIQFAPGTFNAAAWINPSTALSLITLGSPHVSPSMKTYGGYEDPECIQGCAPIPEPETYAMLLAGLGLLAWARRRRKSSSG
jgi:hypothetical protein